MPDILIRNFPAEDLELLDEHAARLGLSRAEYLRRHLRQEARRRTTTVTVADLTRFGQTFQDLEDEDLTSEAWS